MPNDEGQKKGSDATSRRLWLFAGGVALLAGGWVLWAKVIEPSLKSPKGWRRAGSYLRERKKLRYKPK